MREKLQLRLNMVSHVFWINNASSIFIRLVNNVLHAFIKKFVVIFFDNILVYSSKQKVVSRTSTKRGYMAMDLDLAYAKIMWLMSLLDELFVMLSCILVIFIDSITAQALCHNLMFYARTKNIEVDHHFLHD